MILTMLINRTEDWFYFTDLALDPHYIAMTILHRLSTRKKVGLRYNRVELIRKVIDKKSEEALKAFDVSIILLSSRKLISIEKGKGLECNLFITEAGLKALDIFKEELKKCDY